MKHEYSSGAVLYTETKKGPLFTLVLEQNGTYGFPKGHIEGNETEEETALREIYEETGIRANLIPGFRKEIVYLIQSHTTKHVSFFLASFENQYPCNRHNQVYAVISLPFNDAFERLTYESSQDLLEKAMHFLEENGFVGNNLKS